jgi:uncharacterized repeat protein (TIGR01451 family)
VGATTPSGAANSGEVEDYQVTIAPSVTVATQSTTPSLCVNQGGVLSGSNLFTAADNGTFGVGSGAVDAIANPNPYPGLVTGTGGNYITAGIGSPFNPAGSFMFASNVRTTAFGGGTGHTNIIDADQTTTGRFLVVNGSSSLATFASQNVSGLLPNTNYEISLWYANLIAASRDLNDPNISIRVNGVVGYTSGPVPETSQMLWRRVGFVFNTGASTTALIEFIDNTGQGSGNDFLIDTITVKDCTLPSATVTGNVYLDGDGNNSYSSGTEAGLPSISVNLINTQGDAVASNDVIVSTVASQADGSYSFTNVPLGSNYIVRVNTADTDLPASTTLGTPNNLAIALSTNGQVVANQDFGFDSPQDYSDAPTSGTAPIGTGTNNYGVANHRTVSTLKLGANIDSEAVSLASATADGDDTNGTLDDEDGVTLPALTAGATTYSIPSANINLTNTSGSTATLHAWVDFNKDGTFESTEYASTTVNTGTSGSNPTTDLTWSSISVGASGNTFARFRLTTSAAVSATTPSGGATNGEVEDYQMAITNTANPVLSTDFCQASASSRNLLFILDDSSSVDLTELQAQRQAVMDTLNDFVAKNLTGQAAIVGFDSVGRTVIDYTDITTANLATFQAELNSKYGVPGSGTHWEKGFQAGIALGVNKPNVVFFFTDGTNNSGASPDDKANQFKNAGAHIYGIGIQGLTINDGFQGITDGNDTVTYNGSNLLEADFLPITDYSTLQNQYTNVFLGNLCPADFGDAPDTYGTNNIVNSNEPLGANHRIAADLFLGTTAPDTDANGFVDGIENNTNATDDDVSVGTGTGNGNDEGNFTFPILNAGKKNYTISMSNITVTNTSSQPAILHAWIDFNKDGKFDPTEYASAVVNSNTTAGNPAANLTWSSITVGTTGNTYARFRLTRDSSINLNTPGGAANDGEVEDYQVAIAQASDPNLLLVKRITAINPGQPGEIQFNNFDNDADDNSDNNSQWPDSNSNHNDNVNAYLRGVTNSSAVKPGDEVEYTIYFLSTGDINAKSVNICDAVPDHMTFVKNTYGVELGIGLGLDSTTIPLTPNLKLSNLLNDDQGDFYAPGTAPPANLCKKADPDSYPDYYLIPVTGANNDNGAIVVKIQDLPKATAPGVPTNSYGFIRFQAKVK